MSADSPISDQPTLVIRHGLVHDGTGGEPVRADVAISGASITAVAAPGTLPAAPDEIDATGRIVTPGFVDTHSHLDGAVVWESRLTPNSGHGITTTVMGNCGVGFAPCRPDHRDFTIDLMEGVEDIPRDVLEAGLTWTWESYPEYLDALASNRYDMDVFSLLPHSCLRVEAMGVERAIDGSTASAAELATMSELAVAALRAGAVGIASTRLVGQQTRDGRPAPSRFADQDELQTLADAIATAGHGVLQIAPEFNRYPDAVDELTMVIAAAERADIPLTYSLKQTNGHPQGWRQLLQLAADAIERGVRVHPQVLARPTGAVLGLEASRHRFSGTPTYKTIRDLPFDDIVDEMRKPDVRAAILDESDANADRFEAMVPLLFPIVDDVDYEPELTTSVAAVAERTGRRPAELIYDHYLTQDGRGKFLWATGNYAEGNLDFAREMMAFDGAIPGLGDAGAHCSVICDASATTTTLSYWTRDRSRGERLPLPLVIKRFTADAADAFGMHDRGRIEPGRRADINVIDIERLDVSPPRTTDDLPAGGRRLVQDARGYDATVVGGEVVVRDDTDTGARPGVVQRSGQPA